MSVELRIKWEGSVAGLAEHRLSVGSFGLPLYYLLMAIRRRASNIIRNAVDMGSVKVGRFPSDADRIDIEVQSLLASSGGIQSLVQMRQPEPGMQIPIPFIDLPEQATDQTLEAIDKERRGVLSDAGVRKYLGSLPQSITSQEYILIACGETKRKVSFEHFTLPEPITELPCLTETEGRVIGVGFEPGRNQVRVKGQDGEVTMRSDLEAVNSAIEMRNTDVRILYVGTGDQRRLLHLDDPSQPRPSLDVDEFVFNKWASVIKILAEQGDR